MSLFKRTVLIAAAGLLSACVSASSTPTAHSADAPPNIILIIADDLGYGDLAVYGGERIQTPHIDALAADGVRFTNGYVTAAVCAPSRAALLSGRYQQRFGYEFNPVRRDLEGIGIPADVRILPEYLRERGYRTALVGKWHLGRTRETHPMSHGFDEFVGLSPGATGYLVEPGEGDEWLPDPLPGSPEGFWPMRLERGYEREERTGGYLTDILTDEAVGFIGRNRDRPFFLTLAYNAPHTPLQASAPYVQRYAHIEDPSARLYAAMVSAMDDGVGRVMAALREQGLSERTLVIFISDNGCVAYIGAGVCSNAPLRGSKATYLEGGVRVPMIASWPGHLPRGRVHEEPVVSLDWTATILAAAGAETGGAPLDGVNLLPLIEAPQPSSDVIVWRTSPNYAVREGDWKLIVAERADGAGMITYLFNLEADPQERVNRAAEHPEIVQQLQRRYEAWSAQMRPPSFDSERRLAAPLAPNEPPVNLYN
ncbi:sulfatase-like hydrolase/transferase [Terricaulis sp.]|uniref:sulfatase-like hydrolase/transferase n=1 Tax=Terricaulis sp. TaxID=2768686 RepID=UPI002AC71FE1|nr:sulfatase-like hydrolase/transferase [Terricaulis sp.]MDZ4693348.1 sulfatase-like hydrolase/transferase [Terricaulis sp.]